MRRMVLSTVALLAVVCAAQGAAPPDALAACSLSHSNVTVSNNPNQAGAVVNYTAPTVTPPSGNTCGTITCSPPSGSFFPLGATPVICTASGGAAVGFRVTVFDTQPPTITALPNQDKPNAPGLPGATATYSPTATDNAPGVRVACVPPSGSFFLIIVTVVTCTATDASGNTATTSFQVKISDTEPPVLRLPGDLSVLADAGQRERSIAYTAATATDNSGAILTPACTPASGSVFALGRTTVACTVTDSAGNAATGSFAVDLVERLTIAAPTLSICGANSQRFVRQRSVRVCIGSSVGGTVKVSGTLTIGGVRKAVPLAEVSGPVNAGGTAKLRLPIRARTRAAVKKALRRHRRVRAAVTASVSGATGGEGVVAFQVLGSR
jgi:HYR domain